MVEKVLYRYEINYRSEDNDTEIILRKFTVYKETEASYRITVNWRNKWIRKTSYNAYAHSTKEKAKAHFIRRTCKRIDWFDFWKEECKKALKLIEEL